MKVAIKFCGGCDPTYDRLDLFRKIESLAGASIEWRRVEEGGHEAVLLICGCPRACPKDELPHVGLLVSVTDGGAPPEHAVDRLLRKGEGSANQD